MAAFLVDEVEFKLDGAFVRMRTFSGDERRNHAIPIAQFIKNHRKAAKIIAEWEANCADVVSIKLAKRHKH